MQIAELSKYQVDEEHIVLAANGDRVLAMRLLENHELKIEVRTGGAVIIESLN